MSRRLVKQGALILLACAVFFLHSIPVKAEETALDLYKFYDKQYTLVYPDDVLQTITAYLNAQKYGRMMHYVKLSTFDETFISDRIQKLQDDLTEVANALTHGIDLSRDDIYTLESTYKSLLKQVEFYEGTGSVSVCNDESIYGDTPTFEEYNLACNIKSVIESHAYIGSVTTPMKVPASSAAVYDSTVNGTAYYNVRENCVVTALWNGKVAAVTNDRIIINCYNEIRVGYKGLSSLKVDVGDTVYQGQVIAQSSPKLGLKLSLAGDTVDITKLFEEEQ